MYFYLQKTKTTPYALINEGYMKISGKALPVGDEGFFNQFNRQLDKYKREPASTTCVDIALTHVNAASKRSMVQLFKQLETMENAGIHTVINWWYDKDDDDVRELGEIFSAMFNLEFNLIIIEE